MNNRNAAWTVTFYLADRVERLQHGVRLHNRRPRLITSPPLDLFLRRPRATGNE